MNEKEQLQKLEADLDRLSNQLAQQQEEIMQLRNQLHGIHPPSKPVRFLTDQPSTFVAIIKNSSLENLIGLRLIHLIGIVVLVTGLSLGVKYAIDKNLVSEGMRIILAYSAGALLYFFSLRLKKAKTGIRAILLSGAKDKL